MSEQISSLTVLFLVTEDWYFWMHRLALARAVKDAGATVVVATSHGRYTQPIKDEGFVFVPMPLVRGSWNPAREIVTLWRLARLYARVKPDLVHHVALKAILYGSLAARLSGVPCVVNAIMGLGTLYVEKGVLRRWGRRCFEVCLRYCLRGVKQRVLFENPDDLARIVGQRLVPPGAAVLISGSGVDPIRFSCRPEPSGTAVILFSGRMIRDKGVFVLAEAARLLQRCKVQCRIVLCGKPDKDNPTAISEDALRKWETEGIMSWIGHQDDMPLVLASCHIVCLPTMYGEGIPVCLIEGAACGKALVATDTPGCREIIVNEWNGILVPPGEPEALAKAIGRLVNDVNLRKTMGVRGRELVRQRFAADTVHKQIFRAYRDLLGHRWPMEPAQRQVLALGTKDDAGDSPIVSVRVSSCGTSGRLSHRAEPSPLEATSGSWPAADGCRG